MKKKNSVNVITPTTQYANISGILNNSIKPIIKLEDLTDIEISEDGLKENDVLVYNGEKWVNRSIPDTLKDYILGINGSDADGWEGEFR